jgi:hypothetical protein
VPIGMIANTPLIFLLQLESMGSDSIEVLPG